MLSLPHLVVIFLVALVVLGPEKLPEVARVMGKMMAQFRRVTGDFRYQIESEMRDLERQARMRETEEYERTLAGAVPAPLEASAPASATPVNEAIAEESERTLGGVVPAPLEGSALPSETAVNAVNEAAVPVEAPVPVDSNTPASPEKSPDGESHPA